MVLEPIFETDFLPCSHGFRQGYSPHTALRDVVRMYPRVSWVIEGDIVGCFDNIPHHGLLKAVARRIADEKVMSLVSAFLKAGYMENWQYHQTHSGTPQGGIISPLLCNIFLHQLDEYMISLGANTTQTYKEKDQRKSTEYVRMTKRIQTLGDKLGKTPQREARTELLDQILEQRKRRITVPYYEKKHNTKLGYIRYADDFVILVNGTQEEAREIKKQVERELGVMGLQLSAEKTRITHWDKPISFLGYHIHGEIRLKGVQLRAILSIPKEKERLIRRESPESSQLSPHPGTRRHVVYERQISWMVQLLQICEQPANSAGTRIQNVVVLRTLTGKKAQNEHEKTLHLGKEIRPAQDGEKRIRQKANVHAPGWKEGILFRYIPSKNRSNTGGIQQRKLGSGSETCQPHKLVARKKRSNTPDSTCQK